MTEQFMNEQFRLLDSKQPFLVIQNVYNKYSANTRPVKLSQIKKAYLLMGRRDELYGETMQKMREMYPAHHSAFDRFAGLNPWDQKRVQVKIRRGDPVYGAEADKLITGIIVIPEHVEKLTISPEDMKKHRQHAAKRLQEKHQVSQSVDVQKLFQMMYPMLHSEKAVEVVPAVLLATGRRINELASKGALRPGVNAWTAIFSGQSKTGTDFERAEYEIPILARFDEVVLAWEKARQMLNPENKDLSAKDLANRTRAIQKHVKKHNDDFAGARNLHNFRAIYAAICTEVFNRGNLSRVAYVSHILGENTINPALHYSAINLTNVRRPWFMQIQWEKKGESDETIIRGIEDLKSADISPTQVNLIKETNLPKNLIANFFRRNKPQLISLKDVR